MSRDRLIVAAFADTKRRQAAVAALRKAGIGDRAITEYSPEAPNDGSDEASPIPLYILIGGLVGFAGTFLLQVYATYVDYPINYGGRSAFSWPAYVPIAFEVSVLFAVAIGFVSFLVLNGLPAPYDPAGVSMVARQSTRDRQVVVVRLITASDRSQTLRVLENADALALEEVQP